MGNTASVVTSTVLWASLSTLLVMLPATGLAYLLARREFRGKQILATLVSLPLVLPPKDGAYLKDRFRLALLGPDAAG